MNEALKKLIDVVQQASPVIWQAAYRQVFVDGAEFALLFIVFVLSAILLWEFGRKLADDNADEFGVFFARLGAVVAAWVSLIFFVSMLDCFLNPTFAAIKEIKGLL